MTANPIRIVMDGAGDLPEAWIKEYGIEIIPVNIHFGNQTFLQGVELSNPAFYAMVEKNQVIPKTSQPTPQQFIDHYRKIAQPGETILSVHVTSKLSGTYESSVLAARDLAGQYNVIPFDSAAGSAAMGYMCKEARLMAWAGASTQAILERLEFIRSNINIILTLDTLDYARMSGRVKTLQAALASLLNVKPIVALQNGVLDMADRVRTRKRSLEFILQTMLARVGRRRVNAAVVHAQDPNTGRQLLEMVRASLNLNELIMTDLSISVAANLGPGTVGIIAYPLEAQPA